MAQYSKNDIVTVKIEDIGTEGEECDLNLQESKYDIGKCSHQTCQSDFIDFVVFFIHNIYLVSLSFDTFFMFVHKYSEK